MFKYHVTQSSRIDLFMMINVLWVIMIYAHPNSRYQGYCWWWFYQSYWDFVYCCPFKWLNIWICFVSKRTHHTWRKNGSCNRHINNVLILMSFKPFVPSPHQSLKSSSKLPHDSLAQKNLIIWKWPTWMVVTIKDFNNLRAIWFISTKTLNHVKMIPLNGCNV